MFGDIGYGNWNEKNDKTKEGKTVQYKMKRQMLSFTGQRLLP